MENVTIPPGQSEPHGGGGSSGCSWRKEEIIPKRFEYPIKVPVVVFDGLETVKESGDTPMSDISKVQYIAARLGYPETASWLKEHPQEYSEGLFRGFVTAE